MRHRDRDVNNTANWTFLCRLCGHKFQPDDKQTVGDIADHFKTKHGWDGKRVSVELRWIGLGPAPKASPSFLN